MTDFDSPVYRYRPHTLSVQAVQITLDNARDLADWCGGTVLELHLEPDDVIMAVDANYLHTYAYLGDWIVMGQDKALEVMDTERFREAFRPMIDRDATAWPTTTGPIPAPRLGTGL